MTILFQALLVLGLVLLIAFVTLIPLILWTRFQEADKPSWQLIGIFILLLLFPPLAALVTFIYCLNIIITHKARLKKKYAESSEPTRANTD
ncbi:hypothetical protein ACR0ST_12460 [Aliidiomarina sp. Khilg15.8]